MFRFATLFIFAASVAGCSAATDEPAFQHEFAGDLRPWTDETFDSSDDKFMFAVFSDLTGGEREGVFATAVAQLNLLRPELIINVGDLIEGGSEDLAEIAAQWDSFDERAERARAPVFYVGGNHDLTGTVLQGVWDERIGRRYYHFVYKDVLFLVLDTEDNTPERTQEIFDIRKAGIEVYMNEGPEAFAETAYAKLPEKSTGNLTVEQSTYLVEAIAANPDVLWTFLFMHKAPWERAEETNFAVVEEALADRPYTVFNGHVHSYEHIERRGRDYIRLATTGGKQFLNIGRSMDHVTLVTVDDAGVDIANLLLSGVLDKTGHVPLGGDEVCFERAKCTDAGEN
jgi:3',5'-cyclic AMP phosphodiesterase CpdA